MSLSPELIQQIFAQNSTDPFLTLITLSHPNWPSDLRFVNNTVNIISRSNTFLAFPFSIVLPKDDGESVKQIKIDFDNVSLELIDEIRSASGNSLITINIEMILASLPDVVQMSYNELEILSANYNRATISLSIGLNDFLIVGLTSEKYAPSNFRGLF